MAESEEENRFSAIDDLLKQSAPTPSRERNLASEGNNLVRDFSDPNSAAKQQQAFRDDLTNLLDRFSQPYFGIGRFEDLVPENKNLEEEEQIKQGLGLDAINNPAETDDYFALADFDMLASLYDLQAFDNESNIEYSFGLERRMPRYYGDLQFSQQGMFNESQNEDLTGEMIPFAGPAGLGLGLMTARFGELRAAISEERALTSPPKVGETNVKGGQVVANPGYGADDIGETEIIDRRFLAPGEELPKAPVGMEWTLREEEFQYDINTAMANYESLNDEEQKKFAEALLSLGYMDGNTEWLTDPDKIYEEDFVRAALVAVSDEFSVRKKQQGGEEYGDKSPSITNKNAFPQGDPLLTSFIPQLGLEGGLFDTPDATIVDLESFVEEARLKAGVLRTVPTNMIAKQIEDWSLRNLGRKADASLQALGLQIAENVVTANVGSPSQPSDRELLTAVDQNLLGAVDDETRQEATNIQNVDANTILTKWLMNSGRTVS